jgi:hypothetical protein
MGPYVMDDPIIRENRRAELARRLISHGVRTQIISQLTGMTRNRLATVRRRLMVSDDTRRRGPPPSSPGIFLHTPQARAEGAALASLCHAFGIPAERGLARHSQSFTALDYGERLCETYEAYRSCVPQTNVELEELILLRRSLATGDVIRLGKCRRCRCLMLIERFDNDQRWCGHCNSSA